MYVWHWIGTSLRLQASATLVSALVWMQSALVLSIWHSLLAQWKWLKQLVWLLMERVLTRISAVWFS